MIVRRSFTIQQLIHENRPMDDLNSVNLRVDEKYFRSKLESEVHSMPITPVSKVGVSKEHKSFEVVLPNHLAIFF